METLLSWAIGRNAACMSNQQLSDHVFENANMYIDQFVLSSWRNGWSFPKSKKQRDALAATFNYKSYGQLLVPKSEQAMSVLFVAEKMGMPVDTLRLIKLRKKVQARLMLQMREAIDITGDEYAAIGVAIAFWSEFFQKKHPVLFFKEMLNKQKGR